MKSKMLILMLLSTGIYAHSEGIDSVYAEYCLILKSANEVPFSEWPLSGDGVLFVELSLVKKYKELKSISLSSTQAPLVCDNYYFHPLIEFEFIDKSGKEVFIFSVGESPQSAPIGFGGWGTWHTEIGPIPVKRQPMIHLDLPKTGRHPVRGITKAELLPFKNKTINAYTNVRLRCLPHLDTTYRFDFPVKITGECKP